MSVNTRNLPIIQNGLCYVLMAVGSVCSLLTAEPLLFVYCFYAIVPFPPLSNKNFTLIIYLSICYYVASKISPCYLSLTIILYSKEKQGDEAAIHLCFPPHISSMEQESSSHLDGNFLAFYVYGSL